MVIGLQAHVCLGLHDAYKSKLATVARAIETKLQPKRQTLLQQVSSCCRRVICMPFVIDSSLLMASVPLSGCRTG